MGSERRNQREERVEMGEVEAGRGGEQDVEPRTSGQWEPKEASSVRGELWGNDAREVPGRAEKRS